MPNCNKLLAGPAFYAFPRAITFLLSTPIAQRPLSSGSKFIIKLQPTKLDQDVALVSSVATHIFPLQTTIFFFDTISAVHAGKI